MRNLAAASILGIAVLSGGCGGPASSAAPPSSAEALRHVQTALDAWKAGKAKGLASANPPLRFVDPDMEAGAKLDSYAPGGDPKATDHVVDYPVELTITERKKGTRTVRAVYQVVAEPALAVLRNDP